MDLSFLEHARNDDPTCGATGYADRGREDERSGTSLHRIGGPIVDGRPRAELSDHVGPGHLGAGRLVTVDERLEKGSQCRFVVGRRLHPCVEADLAPLHQCRLEAESGRGDRLELTLRRQHGVEIRCHLGILFQGIAQRAVVAGPQEDEIAVAQGGGIIHRWGRLLDGSQAGGRLGRDGRGSAVVGCAAGHHCHDHDQPGLLKSHGHESTTGPHDTQAAWDHASVHTPLSDYDTQRLVGLERARRRATGLLAIMAGVFVSTFFMGEAAWVGFLRTTAEASMIGGLADWFAVTALFRHPLGIPIPHTAVIPNSKDGLGRNLAEFVRQNFLAPEQIVERIDGAHLPERLGRWLTEGSNADQLAGHVATTVGALAEGLDAAAMEDELERAVVDRLRSLPMAEMVGRGMEAAIVDGQHRPLLSAAIAGVAHAMEDNRQSLRKRLGEESPWWVPTPVDDAVFERAYTALGRFLDELAADADHEIRRTIDVRLAELAHRLRTDPELGAVVAARVEDLASHPTLRAWARGTWSELAGALVEASHSPDSRLRRRIATSLVDLGKRLESDDELGERANTWMRSLAPPLARVGRRELGDLIAATVEHWDTEDTSRRLELWMGRDLQFIRINGTVVGGLAGLAIHTTVFLLGGT